MVLLPVLGRVNDERIGGSVTGHVDAPTPTIARAARYRTDNEPQHVDFGGHGMVAEGGAERDALFQGGPVLGLAMVIEDRDSMALQARFVGH